MNVITLCTKWLKNIGYTLRGGNAHCNKHFLYRKLESQLVLLGPLSRTTVPGDNTKQDSDF